MTLFTYRQSIWCPHFAVYSLALLLAAGPLVSAAVADVGPGGEWVLTGPPAGGGRLIEFEDGTVRLFGDPVQRYVPSTGNWTPAGSTVAGSVFTLLANGKVLATGLSPASVYDPTLEVSTVTGAMIVPRTGHRATLLASGQVLVSGGTDANGQLVGPAELYNPATGTWNLTGTNTRRDGHVAVLLPTARVLVAGGGSLTAELYNPATGLWELTNPNLVGGSVGAFLPGGKVLVVGQLTDPVTRQIDPASQMYDVESGTWSPSLLLPGIFMLFGRATPAALTVTKSGPVLVVSTTLSFGCFNRARLSANLLHPSQGGWIAASPPPFSADNPSLATLPDGRTLLVGGDCSHPTGAALFRLDNSTARLAIDPSSINFGTVAVGATVQRTISVLNTGQATLHGSVTVSDGAGFTVTSGATFDVPSGGHASSTVAFTSSDVGRRTGTATFMSNGGWVNVALEARVGIQLSGRITGADGVGVPAVPVELHGTASASTTTDTSGRYSFFVEPNSNTYTVLPASPTLTFTPASRTLSVSTDNVSGLDFVVATISGSVLRAAVLPSSRSVQLGHTATAFATIINSSAAAASACGISPISIVPATFAYQTTNASTNALTGTVNTPVVIPGGQAQSYVIAFTPTGSFLPTDVQLGFDCNNTESAPITTGLNTLLLVSSATPVPDVVALAATTNNDGIVHIQGTTSTGVFAVATSNVGAGGAITVSADTGAASLPITMLLCQTNAVSGACLAAPSSSISTHMNASSTATFGVFVAANGSVAFDPSINRVTVRFTDSNGVVRGATSVAVSTQ